MNNLQIQKIANTLNISNFRGVFMRDQLPKTIKTQESGILNLDSVENPGTHWVCYFKAKDGRAYYFDSYGLDPPEELINYLGPSEIISSTFQIQKFNTDHCGQLCLLVLKLLEKYDFKEIILSLINN